MKPGDERVPGVPDHIQGQDVRLLVGEALVLGRKTVLKLNSFLNDLDPKDLTRLRQITLQVAALSTLRQNVDNGTLH